MGRRMMATYRHAAAAVPLTPTRRRLASSRKRLSAQLLPATFGQPKPQDYRDCYRLAAAVPPDPDHRRFAPQYAEAIRRFAIRAEYLPSRLREALGAPRRQGICNRLCPR